MRIKTWRQRCEEHPDHDGIVSDGMIHARMQEEIDELRDAIEQSQQPIAWVYPEALEAFKSGKPWTAYGSNGDGRIPLYLNDAVARRVEPRSGESGAGFESLPASPSTWWHEPVAKMNYRPWQGLTDEDREEVLRWVEWKEIGSQPVAPQKLIAYVERKLREKNT